MIKHYFKTTFRYLRAYKLFSAINLVGLAVAFSVVYYAVLFVHFELSYDQFNTNADRILRLSTNVETPAGITHETSAGAVAGAVQSTFPEVENTTRIFLDYYIVQKDQDAYGEETLAYADPSVFSVFSFPLISGNAATVFNNPYAMVLSETAAKKYFGTTDCINKTLTLDGKITATVTGVMKDIPQNSHFRTDIFLSMSSLIKEGTNWMTNWSRFGFSTYVLLKENVSAAGFTAKLAGLAKEHPLKNNLQYSLVAEPLNSLYLHGQARGNKAGATASGNYTNIYVFSIVAIFVLFIACFNFINLTTALSLKRAKEIGVRKVTGATRQQLTYQFLTDALTVSLIAFAIAVILCAALQPFVNNITGKVIATGMAGNIKFAGLFLMLAIVTGLLSGLYPALVLARFKPVSNLKGKFVNNVKGLILRKGLVITQFTISIVLIIATIVVYSQLNFMQNENLGFKKEHNLVIDFHYDERIGEHGESVMAELASIPGIHSASISSSIPGRSNTKYPTTIEGANKEPQELQADAYFVDYNFLKQYGLEVVAGRGFSKDFAEDMRDAMVINESAVKRLGFNNAADAIGKPFSQRGGNGLIIGVIKDFHFHSLHEAIMPLTMQVSPGFFTFLTLGIASENMASTVSALQKKWSAIAPGLPLVYNFADDTFNAQYKADNQFGKLFVCFAVLSVFISCLGLLGLTSFSTVQRTKEIGIRKVLGASVASIIALITKEFILMVFIALIIATPIAAISMKYWLNDFAYHIPVKAQYFLMAGMLAILVALLTLSVQSVKAAIANPVKTLKTE
ncbi:MAG: FtsX-like permease family protein [Ferruginibacter sp.]|uniref:ABC transporter permease n=1 Tax=Ferruginibacter sp. TaxID=1940288 RepID=UPI00265A7121|nr:ABC transporter permease [Ferruginibacter sp.]MDB5280304.1 FtsX-like permease family protein [Ferruginibacter sp.]